MMSLVLPLRPLLRVFLAAPGPPSARSLAVQAARTDWLNPDFLDAADEAALRDRLIPFYEAVVEPPLHAQTLARRVRLVRHGLNHLLRGGDPLLARLDRCARSDGPYAVPGLGPMFWAAIAQATGPDRLPGWTPTTEHGLGRLGMLKRTERDRLGAVFGRMAAAYAEIRAANPGMNATQIDDFLVRVADTRGRELAREARDVNEMVKDRVRQVRSKHPLRERLKAHQLVRTEGRSRLEAALQAQDPVAVQEALRTLGPGSDGIHDEALLEWVGRLWTAADPFAVLADYWQTATLLGGGPWLPAAVLHLRDPLLFPVWDEDARRGLAAVSDGYDPAGPTAESYNLFAEGCDDLRRRYRLHPLEVPDVLVAAVREPDDWPRPDRFDGFCTDTFAFFAELAANNNRAWMDAERERYQFAVRGPMVELCRALAARYVEPVLNRQLGWDLETKAKSGRALSSIVRNDHGRTVPYESAVWVTFYRRAYGGKRDDVQLFVRLDARGVAAGLSLGRRAREAGRLFRRNVQQHAEPLYRALAATDALKRCRFLGDNGVAIEITGPADLRKWATGKALVAERLIPAASPQVRGDDLVGEILLTFDRLLPAYRCVVEDDPRLALGGPPPAPAFGADQFCESTYLSPSWLQTATGLLSIKRQLILQGVPGSGKTHVAKLLARLLTGGAEDRVRLIQFHPAFSYEEFVEGIKARTIEVDGRHEVTYPVEDGVLCQFAAKATSRPTESFVLLVDEINRGNLPRVFGELLYLLEYRDQEVTLPYSRRPFRLPPNLYLIGTMNAADRSVALVDQALRRRFSFLEMPPDARVLASWLEAHPPADEAFGPKLVALFEALNRKLADEAGPTCQIGHSYFMVPGLDRDRLRTVWDHHVRPVLGEYFTAHPQRLAGYDLDMLMGGKRVRARSIPLSEVERGNGLTTP
jgi:5-methylcytosine-specific restriction enzyme B